MDFSPKEFSNTEFERLALANRINFSDGHARQTFSENQEEILRNINRFIEESTSCKQLDLERNFISDFFLCATQSFSQKASNTFLNYSSSCSIKIAAQACRQKGLKVFLIEPCFDNIRHILCTENVPIEAISENQVADPSYLKNKLDESTAVWLVQPNNPTGFCLPESEFISLINLVTSKKATLVVDFCFRFYSKSLKTWNQYELLLENNTSFITIEDTGKTWSLLDNKVGITVCSDNFKDDIHRLHDELLLNVSPFQLILLTEFIRDTIDNGNYSSFLKDIERNRTSINTLVKKKLLSRASRWYENVPMELLRIPSNIQAINLWEELRSKGIDILPARNYYWTDPNRGNDLLRIPLSRPVKEFEIAIPIMEETIMRLLRYEDN